MSIINDALKKTQANLDKNQGQKQTQDLTEVYKKLHQKQVDLKRPVQKSDASPIEKKRSWYKTLFTILIIISILTGILFAVFIYLARESSFMKKWDTTFLNNILSTFKRSKPSPSSKPAKPSPPPIQYKPGELVLTGVMTAGDKSMALINGEVYEVGDSIDGKKIINITLDKVDLLENGKIESLRTK